MSWKTLDDIDWGQLERVYALGVPQLLAGVEPSPRVTLKFWTDTNGGFNFDAYQRDEAGDNVRLGELAEDWGSHWEDLDLDDKFEQLNEALEEAEDFETGEAVVAKMQELLRQEVEKHAGNNYGLPADVTVNVSYTGG
jgi:hypothetical protein